MTLKHTHFSESEVFKNLERQAVDKGELTEKDVVKTASVEESLEATGDLKKDIINLAHGLRRRGFVSEADALEEKFFVHQAAKKKVEDEKTILDEAHPDGDVEVVSTPSGLGKVWTEQSAHKMIREIVEKTPTGKQAQVKDLLDKTTKALRVKKAGLIDNVTEHTVEKITTLLKENYIDLTTSISDDPWNVVTPSALFIDRVSPKLSNQVESDLENLVQWYREAGVRAELSKNLSLKNVLYSYTNEMIEVVQGLIDSGTLELANRKSPEKVVDVINQYGSKIVEKIKKIYGPLPQVPESKVKTKKVPKEDTTKVKKNLTDIQRVALSIAKLYKNAEKERPDLKNRRIFFAQLSAAAAESKTYSNAKATFYSMLSNLLSRDPLLPESAIQSLDSIKNWLINIDSKLRQQVKQSSSRKILVKQSLTEQSIREEMESLELAGKQKSDRYQELQKELKTHQTGLETEPKEKKKSPAKSKQTGTYQRSNVVVQMQQKLMDLGKLLKEKGHKLAQRVGNIGAPRPDGAWGPETTKALQAAQEVAKDYGLSVDLEMQRSVSGAKNNASALDKLTKTVEKDQNKKDSLGEYWVGGEKVQLPASALTSLTSLQRFLQKNKLLDASTAVVVPDKPKSTLVRDPDVPYPKTKEELADAAELDRWSSERFSEWKKIAQYQLGQVPGLTFSNWKTILQNIGAQAHGRWREDPKAETVLRKINNLYNELKTHIQKQDIDPKSEKASTQPVVLPGMGGFVFESDRGDRRRYDDEGRDDLGGRSYELEQGMSPNTISKTLDLSEPVFGLPSKYHFQLNWDNWKIAGPYLANRMFGGRRRTVKEAEKRLINLYKAKIGNVGWNEDRGTHWVHTKDGKTYATLADFIRAQGRSDYDDLLETARQISSLREFQKFLRQLRSAISKASFEIQSTYTDPQVSSYANRWANNWEMVIEQKAEDIRQALRK